MGPQIPQIRIRYIYLILTFICTNTTNKNKVRIHVPYSYFNLCILNLAILKIIAVSKATSLIKKYI